MRRPRAGVACHQAVGQEGFSKAVNRVRPQWSQLTSLAAVARGTDATATPPAEQAHPDDVSPRAMCMASVQGPPQNGQAAFPVTIGFPREIGPFRKRPWFLEGAEVTAATLSSGRDGS